MESDRWMLDAFLCRYGHQRWPDVQAMSLDDKRILGACIRAHIDGETVPDPSGGDLGS